MATYSVQGQHPTTGLAGYPARDYMAPAGTPVYAWEILRVSRITGGSGARGTGVGGFNVYLTDRTGRNFFVTHVENVRVKVGDQLRPGQAFAQVGAYKGMANHVHIGWQGGDPVNVLGLQPAYVFTPGGAVAGSQVVTANSNRSRQASPGGKDGPLANVPVLGSAGRAAVGGLDWLLSPVDKTIGVVKAPFNALQWATSNWDRVLEVTGGVVLVLVGLILMGRSLGVTKTKVEIVEAAGRFQGQREYAAAGSPPPATRENLRAPTVHEATDEGERKAERRARRAAAVGSSQGDEIPF